MASLLYNIVTNCTQFYRIIPCTAVRNTVWNFGYGDKNGMLWLLNILKRRYNLDDGAFWEWNELESGNK